MEVGAVIPTKNASKEDEMWEVVDASNMFKALRRLHGQNLESRGLNDMSEAFQSFVTRARFFSVGKLRWVNKFSDVKK
ncbi:hypothetical protein ANCDUO_13885 [Ancylostoma duodenale]|uniref:Uncharacterized protein n=1 Tax=Ancylostoma duodenale TaxID=51022 RepID=A0A0C2GAM3_9BILA|nr:hypothetical protein ANCDUO_13885 [Ancylostoma duodenale]